MLELKPEVMPEHPCYLDSYLIRRKVKGIIFKVTKDTFTKCYETPDYISIEEQRIRYLNELTVYKYFKKIDWKWSPRLLDYSENSITIERKKYKTIDEHLHCNSLFNIDKLIEDLKILEADMMANNINCKGFSNKDILLGKQIWLVDFEETKIEKYSQSLFVYLSYDLSRRWNGYYKDSKQKYEYRRKLYLTIIKQLFKLKTLYSLYFTLRYRVGNLSRSLGRK